MRISYGEKWKWYKNKKTFELGLQHRNNSMESKEPYSNYLNQPKMSVFFLNKIDAKRGQEEHLSPCSE